MIKVFYDPKQSVSDNKSSSPSAGKPAQVLASWQNLGIPFSLMPVQPVSREDLKLVHDPEYVDGVLDLKIANGFGNKIPSVAMSLPWVAGSMVAAALDALKTGDPCFSLTSGAHHARYDQGGGFCTFNFLVLAAVQAHAQGAERVLIVDLDQHYGDGTADIIKRLKLKFIDHYTFGRFDVTQSTAESWLNGLRKALSDFQKPDLIIYNAGVDPHINDPLGGTLTTEQMKRRDCLSIC